MKELPINGDKLSISLSILCALHCLALPIIITMLPATFGVFLESEAFHLWMVIAVIPVSLYAFTLGCKKHRNYSVITMGVIGLAFLVSALVLEEVLASEFAEKGLTMIGVCIIALSHFMNFRMCHKHDENCHCESES